MSRIGCWELAHEQTHSSEDVYGERRDNEQRKLRVVGMAYMLCCVRSFFSLCIADEYVSNANQLVWYFLNGAFGILDLFCFPQTRMRPLGTLLRQCSKQNSMPPCSIKEIAQTALKHLRHIHSLCARFWKECSQGCEQHYITLIFV